MQVKAICKMGIPWLLELELVWLHNGNEASMFIEGLLNYWCEYIRSPFQRGRGDAGRLEGNATATYH